MFHMLGNVQRTNNTTIEKVKESFVSHPMSYGELVNPVCFTDEQWGVFKRLLARLAKERKAENKKPLKKNQPIHRTIIRNHFCEDDIIQFDETKPIVRICTDTFDIVIYKNLQNSLKNFHNVEKENVIKCLRGQVHSACGYFWIQK
jgi:hypothetical protein